MSEINSSKPSNSRRKPKNQIIIDIIQEGDVKVSAKWDKNSDPKVFGMAVAALSMGLLGEKADNAVIDNADKTGHYDIAQAILDASDQSKTAFLEHIQKLDADAKKDRRIIWRPMEYYGEPDWEEVPSDEEEIDESDFSALEKHQPILKIMQGMPNKKMPKLPDYTNWWMITNFDIIPEWDSIKKFEGIELATPYSRYTAVLTVGELFNSPSVRKSLEDMLLGNHNN